jgi:hypothetical protein
MSEEKVTLTLDLSSVSFEGPPPPSYNSWSQWAKQINDKKHDRVYISNKNNNSNLTLRVWYSELD